MSNHRRPAPLGWSPLRTSAHHLRAAASHGRELFAAQVAQPAASAAPSPGSSHVVALADDLVDEAHKLAEHLLTSMDDDLRRWRHTQAVAARAAEGAEAVAPQQRNLLLAACWLHDIGYAPSLVRTGFHPIDGARHLQNTLWPPALAGLVAHHSGARFMAQVRGLAHLMAPYDKPGYWTGPVADALTWADQTTGPDGQRVTAQQRIAEVLERHGPQSPQARSQAQRGPALLAAVEATMQRVAASRAARTGFDEVAPASGSSPAA